MSVLWKDWNPGLDNSDMKLGDVCASLPGADPEDIGFLVRLLENPDSPIALPGAVTLERHDCIHIMLGRGLLNQDEAFVVGFTMGSSKRISAFEAFVFKQVSARFYPKSYRFTKQHLRVYQMALEAGKTWGPEELYLFPFEEYMDWTVGDVRATLGLDVGKLKALYQEEQRLFSKTKASQRLPV